MRSFHPKATLSYRYATKIARYAALAVPAMWRSSGSGELESDEGRLEQDLVGTVVNHPHGASTRYLLCAGVHAPRRSSFLANCALFAA